MLSVSKILRNFIGLNEATIVSKNRQHFLRCISSQNGNKNTTDNAQVAAENRIKSILAKTFPKANSIDVVDVSGGCGAMFEIVIQSPQFKGMSIVKQHRLVTEALKEEIKDMHGLRIHTSA